MVLGGDGPEMAFLHANAYPPECYRLLVKAFSRDFHIRAMSLRPLWKDSSATSIHSWHALSADFLAWQGRWSSGPILAVGHSLGAIVALRAALQEPASFRGLVLLDPVLLMPGRILAWRVMRHFPAGHGLHPVIRRAERRRCVFRDMDEVFAAYRRYPIFRRLADDHLKVVIQGLVQSVDGHVQLRYSPAWEARIYSTAIWNDLDLWRGLPTLSVPTLIIRGAESETLTEVACEAARRANGRVQVETVEQTTHLVPLERPLEVYRLAYDFLQHSLEARQIGE